MSPLIDLALLLFGAKLGGILFTRLRQPSIVGELIAGIILGPSLLAIVNPSGLVTSVADLGLLFLILLVSLTIDWRNLEGNTERFAWIEIARVVFTLLIVYTISSIFAWDIYMFLVLAFIAVMSSTAIVSRTLADMKKLDTHEGQSLIGIEVVDTVFGIICVAILASMLSGTIITVEPIMTTVLVVIGLFVVMGRVGFRMVNRLTSSIQKYGVEEALLGFTLLLAFLLGSLTEGLNLESILGVFIAGMVLSRSPQLPIIAGKVKDIGESFFIPIFFASVGLTINIMSASGNFLFMAGLVVMFVAVKVTAAFITLKMFNYNSQQAIKISSGILTLSEMTIVIAALSAAKIDPGILVSIVVSYLIINAVSPVVMNFTFGRSLSLEGSRFEFLIRRGDRNRWKKYKRKIDQHRKGTYSYTGS